MIEQQILTLAREAERRAIAVRQDLHQFPELAYTEIRTASKVARRLTELGCQVKVGREVMAPASRQGLPSVAELAKHYERAARDGADLEFIDRVKDGFTAVVGILRGGKPGPTVAIRADMDALPIPEATDESHLPAAEGFRSQYEGLMHACGHDGHTAIGLGVAEVLAAVKAEITGTVLLIFQPGEEGLKGALPMVDAGVVDRVDYFIGFHLGLDAPSGTIWPDVRGFRASTKLDVLFTGAPAHAGFRPEQGRNALLGAAQATMGLHAISRHSEGASRVNVGLLHGGTAPNIIPETAYMAVEVRGDTAEVNEYMVKRAKAIIEGAALAQDLGVEITPNGSSTTVVNDDALVELIAGAAAAVEGVTVGNEPLQVGASEDATLFMRRVQERGGLAAYIGIGSDLPSGHHTRTFDIREKDLVGGISTLALAAWRIGEHPPR